MELFTRRIQRYCPIINVFQQQLKTFLFTGLLHVESVKGCAMINFHSLTYLLTYLLWYYKNWKSCLQLVKMH